MPKYSFENKIQHHQWEEREGNAFFDHFFIHSPPAGSPLARFPYCVDPYCNPDNPDPDSKSVIEWVLDSQTGRESEAGHARPRPAEQKRPWRSSATQRLEFPSTMYPSYEMYHLKCDVFTYRKKERATTTARIFRWDNVLSIGSIEPRWWEDTDDYDIEGGRAGQFNRCPKAVFGAQPGRMFLHAFAILKNRMRCYLLTRCGVHTSRLLDLTDPGDLLICGRVLYGHTALSEQDMGMCVLWSGFPVKFPGPLTGIFPVTFPSRSFLLGPVISSTDRTALLRHSTTVWYGKEVPLASSVFSIWGEVPVEAAECDFLLKLSHPPLHKRGRERDLYQHCESRAVKGVAKCHAYKELGWSVLSLLGDDCKRAAGYQSWRGQDRIGVVLVLDPGIPLCQFRGSYTDLFACFRDAIRAHYSLLVSGRILHRNISYDNIMITRPGSTRDDRFRGFLINLDQAIRTDQIAGAGAGAGASSDEVSGTLEFMSSRLLFEYPAQHSYYDDLQSFLWVFIWACTPPNLRDKLRWRGTDTVQVGIVKRAYLSNQLAFAALLSKIGNAAVGGVLSPDTADSAKGIEAARVIVTAIRPILEKGEDGTDAVLVTEMKDLYNGMVKAFDDKLPPDQHIRPDWMEAGMERTEI